MSTDAPDTEHLYVCPVGHKVHRPIEDPVERFPCPECGNYMTHVIPRYGYHVDPKTHKVEKDK